MIACTLVHQAWAGFLGSQGNAGSWNSSSGLALACMTGTMSLQLGFLFICLKPCRPFSPLIHCSVAAILCVAEAKYASCHQASSWVHEYVKACTSHLAYITCLLSQFPPIYPQKIALPRPGRRPLAEIAIGEGSWVPLGLHMGW